MAMCTVCLASAELEGLAPSDAGSLRASLALRASWVASSLFTMIGSAVVKESELSLELTGPFSLHDVATVNAHTACYGFGNAMWTGAHMLATGWTACVGAFARWQEWTVLVKWITS